ncbi:hypothetical protein [Paucidesulfovibrio longus]|uniref:hypothetical protein n=1 Tax=Paucidesulfovibrio longus TaxID=889 RepID=UPI0003B39231|nr:hypothetical protein [Paucidesulfovibrio longus]
MQISNIDRLSLENLAPQKMQEARAARVAVPEEAQQSAAPSDSLGMDLEGLGEMHSLNADRVASLIADPFGDE